MTENQWPQDGTYRTPTATQQTPLRPETTFPPVSSGSVSGTSADTGASKTDAAKDEAAELKRQAADSAQTVAETAKTEASQCRRRGKDERPGSPAPGQVGPHRPGRRAAAEGRRRAALRLHRTAQHGRRFRPARRGHRPRAPGRRAVLRRGVLARRPRPGFAADRGEVLCPPASRHLPAARGRRRRPGRTAQPQPQRRSTGNHGCRTARPATRVPDTGMAVPPPPVQMPAPETTTAGFADTYPPSPLDADPLGDGARQDRWASEPAATDPLQQDRCRIRSVMTPSAMIPSTVAVDDQRNAPHRRAREG